MPNKKHSRGRPKGSKNKATLFKEARDREIKENNIETPKNVTPPKIFKLLGYCKCGALVGEIDVIISSKGSKYRCSHCYLEGLVSKLNKNSNREVFASKKEYLEHGINADHLANLPLDDGIDPSEVKVKE